MGMEERDSSMKKTLRNLCLSNGWSYGVFWRFDPRNNMLLTMEDGYYEEHVGSVVDNMLLQVHMLGEGKIGEAALDGNHRWMFLDAMDDFGFGLQFSSGIKTVAVIPVELRGVLQFGSTKEIWERPEFLEQARKFLPDGDNFAGAALAGSACSSLDSDPTDQTELIDSSYVSMSWENVVDNIGDCWTFDSLPFPGEIFNEKTGDQFRSLLVNDGICEDQLSNMVETFEEQFAPSHCPSPLFAPCQMDDLSQWLADSSDLFASGLEGIVSEDMSHTLGAVSSSPSPLSYALNSFEKGKSVEAPSIEDGLIADLGIDIECGEWRECLESVIHPVENNSAHSMPMDYHRSKTECISGLEDGSVGGPQKGLFSELGLEHLLRDVSSTHFVANSCVEDSWAPSKKRRIETCQTMNNQNPLMGHPSIVNLAQPTSRGSQMRNSGSLKERMPKSLAGLLVDDCYRRDAKSCITSVHEQKKREEEPVKATKKRARPGESTRPRPKDRQMIADRIKELRVLIHNGSKLSIDALLSRTVRHIVFMQNLKKHAEKLKLVNEPKPTGQENGLVQKSGSASTSSGRRGSRGATWALEVGGSNLFCPIIVEDLSHPGLMLIEILCEEQGYFLEIVDVVRGFGLTILKGVMEAKDDKIWAHFIVEGNKHVTRMDVFVSLMQLFQGTSTDEVGNISKSDAGKVVNKGSPLPPWSSYQQHQHMMPLPI